MKINVYITVLLLLLGATLTAQVIPQGNSEVEIGTATNFYVTQPLRSYPQVMPQDVPHRIVPRGELSEKRQKKADFLNSAGESPSQVDPLIQEDGFTRQAQDPIENFDGINLNVSPPDPTAAVGPNHVVQMTNGLWSVWDKSGVQAAGFPKSITDPLGGQNSGDPITLYDREADRWFISQFQFGSSLLLAVSQTPDPTGAYNVYQFPISSNDYPHYGIWGNSYLVAGNFSPNGRFYAFNREKILAGDSSAEFASLTMSGFVPGTVFKAPQPVHSEGAGIASGPAPIVWFHDNAWAGVATDAAVIWELDIDWTNPSAATVTGPLEIPLSDFDSFITGTGGDSFANIQQPNTSQRIDALVHVMNYQAHRYDFGTHESMVFNFMVEPVNGTKIAGLRWVELRRTAGNDWSLYQEGTYVDPVANESVFMGGIGMDQQGNIGLAYIKSGETTFPSLYFTGRFAADPLGVMTVNERLIVAGTNSVTSNSRYGDYCQLTRDPSDDLTFWFTGEYSGQPRKTRIASFKISDIVLNVDELDKDASELIVTSADNRLFDLTLLTETTSDILRLSVYDISGKRIVYEQVGKSNAKEYNTKIDLSSASAGIYLVEIGNAKTKLSKKIMVK